MVVDEGLILTDWGTPSSKNDGSLCERGEAQREGWEKGDEGREGEEESHLPTATGDAHRVLCNSTHRDDVALVVHRLNTDLHVPLRPLAALLKLTMLQRHVDIITRVT